MKTGVPKRGVEAPVAYSLAEMDVVGAQARRVLALSASERLYGVWLFESLDEVQVITSSGPVWLQARVRDDLDWGTEAAAIFDIESGAIQVCLTNETYRDLERSYPRALFTLAHECGHALLHPDLLIGRATRPDISLQRRSTHSFFRDTEWQADAFSAAFLAPGKSLLDMHDQLGALSPTDVQRQFGMSGPAARIRLANLEKIYGGLRIIGM